MAGSELCHSFKDISIWKYDIGKQQNFTGQATSSSITLYFLTISWRIRKPQSAHPKGPAITLEAQQQMPPLGPISRQTASSFSYFVTILPSTQQVLHTLYKNNKTNNVYNSNLVQTCGEYNPEHTVIAYHGNKVGTPFATLRLGITIRTTPEEWRDKPFLFLWVKGFVHGILSV